MPMNQKMNKTNLTIRITDEGRQILEESARRLGLNRSSFIELAIRAKVKPRCRARPCWPNVFHPAIGFLYEQVA